MKVISSIRQMQAWSQRKRRAGASIGFVPTMGYLHEGHLSLLRRGRKENDYLVISIFVNPTQFGPKEDYRRYPRDLARDKELAKTCGVDVIFYPTAKAMYPAGYQSWINVGRLGKLLCGSSRPGHFQGVATVVLKLFNIVEPTSAYFGQKDAQQAIIIKRLVQDLCLRLKVLTLPIVREHDGLAMSSRNTYLTRAQRQQAIILYKSLQVALGMIKSGCQAPRKVQSEMRKMINTQPSARIDYIKIVEANSLEEVKKIQGRLLVALVVFFGQTRLIDNVIVQAAKR